MAITPNQEQAIQALWVAKDLLKGDARSEQIKQNLEIRLFANKAFITAALLREVPALITSLVEAAALAPATNTKEVI